MTETTPKNPRARSLGASLGDAFESIARRVSTVVAEVSDTVTLPEPVRTALEDSRRASHRGDFDEALRVLAHTRETHSEQRVLRYGEALAYLGRFAYVQQAVPTAFEEGFDDSDHARAYVHALRSTRALARAEPLVCHDELRRAQRQQSRLSAHERTEFLLLLHVLRALAYREAGESERFLREIRKVRARVELSNLVAYRWLVREATTAFLVLDQADAGYEWVLALREQRKRESGPPKESDDNEPAGPEPEFLDDEREALLRLAAARGDVATVSGLLDTPTFSPSPVLRLSLALLSARVDEAVEHAEAHRRASPDEPAAKRLWALAQVAAGRGSSRPQAAQITQALLTAAQGLPQRRRLAHLQELAHVALRCDVWTNEVREAVRSGLALTTRPPRELVLYLARATASELASSSTVRSDRFDSDALAVAMETDDLAGPDEHSPLRDILVRYRVLAGHEHLLRAEQAIARGSTSVAQAELVDALSDDPHLTAAQRLLGDLARPKEITDLEQALEVATELLTTVSHDAASQGLESTSDTARQIIKVRERLARPLTIAVMGEFSAGKSTFVNALLGASVAPMGVLPTTSTINVFRPGQRGGAHVHLRNGELRQVSAEDMTEFLASIGEVDAKTIRYIELERKEGRLGEVVVVDTPGLNALDPYHERVAREFLDQSDAVIWVFSATRGATGSEAEVIDELHRSGRRLLGVINKIDTVPEEEREAVATYVRERLGNKLVALVTTSAAEALAWRNAPQRPESDPFDVVTRELEQSFFARARELKRELTTQQLDEVLATSIERVEQRTRELDNTAAPSQSPEHRRAEIRSTLAQLSDALQDCTVEIADTLAREMLSLGLLSVDDGRLRDADEQDADYLAAVFEDAVLASLTNTLAQGGESALWQSVRSVVYLRFLPWVRGQLAGLQPRTVMLSVVNTAGPSVRRGETALRDAVAAALRPVSRAWRERVLGLRPTVELQLARAHNREVEAPRAQAHQLRATVLGPLRALRDSPAWRHTATR